MIDTRRFWARAIAVLGAERLLTAASRVPRGLVFAGVAAVAFLAALSPIADGDIYWHLAAGRWMLRHHELLRRDPFTVSALGREWPDVHWLFQLGAAVVHDSVGFRGLTIIKGAFVAVTAFVITRTAERSGGPAARLLCGLMLGASLFAARHLLPLRPAIVTVLFLALSLGALEAWRLGGRARTSWMVVFLTTLQLVWVNVQGLAPLGPALIAAYLVGEALERFGRRAQKQDGALLARPLRPLALALGLCVLASFVTPFGLTAVALPARLLARLIPSQGNVFSTSIAENIPPFDLALIAPAQIAHLWGAMVATGIVLAIVRPRLPPAHVIVLGAFVALALAANRNILLLYVVAPPLLAIALATARPSRASDAPSPGPAPATQREPPGSLSRWLPSVALALLLALLAGEVALASLAFALEAPFGRPTPFRFPVGSVGRLAALGAAGSVFAPDHHGGFLTFHVPALRPYIDTRLVLHTDLEYQAFLSVLDDPAQFDALDATHRFRYVVLTTSNPDRYLGLAAHLMAAPAWSLVYTDGSELLFARAMEIPTGIALGDSTTVDAIAAELHTRFRGQERIEDAATINLARLLIVAGAPRQADRLLTTNDTRAASTLRARARFAAGELGAAETLARLALTGDDSDAPELALLGEIALARGRLGESREWARRALAADPYRPEARSLLERLKAAAHRDDN